jgi:hypothetical protein
MSSALPTDRPPQSSPSTRSQGADRAASDRLSSPGRIGRDWPRRDFQILLAILAIGLGLRLVGIGLPFLDSMAQRQAQDAMVARNLYHDGMTLWCPRLDIFGVSTGCTVLEFPLVPGLAALLYYAFGEHAMIGRLVSVAFWVATMPLMVRLARRFLPPVPALSAIALYTLSPMNIYFSRAFMGESSLMFFSVGAVTLFLGWLEQPRAGLYFGSAACVSLAMLTKPTAAIVLVPILSAWWLVRRGNLARRADVWFYLCMAWLPFLLWAAYANYANTHNPDMPAIWQRWDAILTKFGSVTSYWILPQYYRNVTFWIAGVLLTPLGILGVIVGLGRVPPGMPRAVLYPWLAAVIGSTFLLAGATYEHSYYHLPLLPVSALLFGYGVARLRNSEALHRRLSSRSVRYAVSVAAAATVLAYSLGYYVFYSYMYDTSLRLPYGPAVAEVVRSQAPPGGGVILNQPGDTTQALTYELQRQSWDWKLVAQGQGQQAIRDLESLRARGATTYVAIDTKYGSGVAALKKDEELWRYLNEHYEPVVLSVHYAVFDLRRARAPESR